MSAQTRDGSTAAGAPLVRVDAVTVRHAGEAIAALDGVTLRMERGERVGVVGASGSGKSTLALALGGLLPRTASVEGRIEIEGVDPAGPGAGGVRGDVIGWVFQNPHAALNPVRRVEAHFLEALAVRGVTGRSAELRARALLDEVGLEDPDRVAEAHPHELSGGMAQRVCVALALVGDPRLVVADEATSALDAVGQRGLVDLLARLTERRGTALLFVSHDLRLVREVCPRIVGLAGGRLVFDGPASELGTAPAPPEIAALVRASARFALPEVDRGRSGRPSRGEAP